jgi:DNA-directed RNA polymerase specialized sigma24 family protein
MDDPILASRAAAGDLDSLGQLYDRYFASVYDFAWRVLRDGEAAAEVTRETFVRASRHLASASRAVSFRAWLLALAHEGALARATASDGAAPVYEEAFGAFDEPDPCRLKDPSLVSDDHELGCFVWEAATSLGARDYALLDLHVRQGLDADELAPLIGGRSSATVLTRLEAAAGDAMQTYVVARRGNRDCARVQEVLASVRFPPYTDDVRRAVDDHVLTCEACRRTKSLVAAPLDVLAAFAAAPAPFVLKGDIWRELVALSEPGGADTAAAAMPVAASAGEPDMALPAYAGAGVSGLAAGLGNAGAAGASGGYDGGGRTVARGEQPWQKPVLFAVAAAVILIVAILAATAVAGILDGDGDGVAGVDETETAQASPTRGTPGVALETPTEDLTPSTTPTPEETATETAEAPTNTPEPEPPTATFTPIVVPATPTQPSVPPPTNTPLPPILFPTRTSTPAGG